MVAQDDDQTPGPLESRPPKLDDLIRLCAELNRLGARYVVIGGMAMIAKGSARSTEDIDFLVDSSVENVKKIKEALLTLHDQAAKDIEPNDVKSFEVVRVADEIVVDLLHIACGLTFEDVSKNIENKSIAGVSIPYPTTEMMLKLKQGVRQKDEHDRAFLLQLLQNK